MVPAQIQKLRKERRRDICHLCLPSSAATIHGEALPPGKLTDITWQIENKIFAFFYCFRLSRT